MQPSQTILSAIDLLGKRNIIGKSTVIKRHKIFEFPIRKKFRAVCFRTLPPRFVKLLSRKRALPCFFQDVIQQMKPGVVGIHQNSVQIEDDGFAGMK